MKLINRLTSTVLASIITLTTSISAVSNAVSLYVDNDDPIYQNYQSGFNTYLTSANYYRGDARQQSPSYSSCEYKWGPNTYYTSSVINVTLYVYLNDFSFTDPAAQYRAKATTTWDNFLAFNQNTAPSTWCYVGNINLTPFPGMGSTVTFECIQLNPSGSSGCSTGADGVYMIYT